ncbi:Cyclin, N-terminal [Kalmanozyma brasiliensis GHG001]|uniref:Putative Clb1-B-type cyclin 1 n=1 Tax=Kalmanozyma brasiliensis (strain GHG001) TaxID=1365824 RepID=V5GPV4_KALBG|nr:Cyclin, N-terminal [Kalmanozyma brasiliensis GHG001]EST07992.1 Cyclin, N-terminal [Kalmanozyma brasiliensis GHG001]
MSQNLASRRIPLRTRSTASVNGTQAKENAGVSGVSSRTARYGLEGGAADAGPSKPASTVSAATKVASAASGVLGTRKRAALGDLTNANRARTTMTGADDKGKAALKDAIKPRATTSATSASSRSVVGTSASTAAATNGAARRVVRTRPTTASTTTTAAAADADRPFRASRRVVGTTTSASSAIPSATSRSTSTTSAVPATSAVAAARKGSMVRTTSASSQTGLRRDAAVATTTAPAAVVASRSSKSQLNEVQDTDDKMEAPQAKRLKTEQAHKPAKDEGWEDLDAEDAEDPLMVAEYVNDIFEYMKELEIINMPTGDYMSQQNEINWDVRAILVDWLVDIHAKFRLLPETLYLAVNIIDRFLSRRTISLSKLQLVGVTAMFIASKYEEVMCPSIQNFYYLADGGYTDVEILRAERYVLKVLDFSMSYANPMNFLRRISKADNYDIQTRTVAKYFMEISLLDYRLMEHPPSLVAAASVWLAREVLERGEWTPTLVHYSTYSEQELLGTAEIMLDYCLRPITHQFFHKKYAHKKFMRASTYVIDWAHKTFPEGVVGVDEAQDLNVLRIDLYERKEIERPEQSPVSSSRANTPATSNHAQAHFDAEPSPNVDADETYDYPEEEDDLDEEEGLEEELVDGKAGGRQDTRPVLREVTNAYEETF